MATVKQVQDFIAKISPIVVEICNSKNKKVLPSVCIAQACCESAYGTSSKMVKANALLGIKVGKSKVHFGKAWKDMAYSTKTKECYDGKTYVEINDMFRAYETVKDAIEDYYDMMASCSRYAGCIGILDPKISITAIKNGGYATSPTYVSTITSIIKKYNLTQFDVCMTGVEVNAPATKTYTIGKNYTLQSNLYVRYDADGKKKKFLSLTTNGKSNAYQDEKGNGILKKGTVVTVKEIKIVNGATWLQIPSGWICGISSDSKSYVK